MTPLWMIVFIAIFSTVHGIKVLMVFNAISRSHYILGEALGLGLAEKGHQVTLISPFVSNNKHRNYQEIVLDGMMEEGKKTQFGNLDFDVRNVSTIDMMQRILSGGTYLANVTMHHPKVQKLMNSNSKFDVFITEIFLNDCLLGMARHFNAFAVVLSTVGSTSWTDSMVGNPNNPAYVAHPLLSFDSPMTYFERVISALFSVVDIIFSRSLLNTQHKIYEDYFKQFHKGSPEEFPHLGSLIKNVSLLLINSNPLVSSPRALVPNMVDVCGLHIKPKNLPENIRKFLDSAKDGAIYFSMGSNLKSAQLPKEQRDFILKVFRDMKQKILWKWEDTELPDKPDNVLISPWLPQQAILAHPNTKAFITHGGLLSSIETLYFGVPLLGIPIFGDQQANMARAVRSGYGIKLEFDDLSEKTLSQALNKILYETKYYQKAKALSKIFQDHDKTPLERAVSSIEYVVRHNGAHFLRSPATDMPLHQILLLDVVVGLIFLVFLVIFLLRWILKIIARACCRRNIKVKFDPKKKKK